MNEKATCQLLFSILIAVLTASTSHAQSQYLAQDRTEVHRVSRSVQNTPATARTAARPLGFSLMSSSPVNTNLSVIAASGQSLQVLGSGTTGRLTKWTGLTSTNSFIGDTSIFEDKNGLVGIGTDTPSSKLTVAGMIQITLGGLKFPDGTIQTTSAAGALTTVAHDTTLTGSGTATSPLGVASPLLIRDLDNPARQPIQATVNCEADTGILTPCAGDIFTVPVGKRLVIEFISLGAFAELGVKVILEIRTNANSFGGRYFFSNFTQPVSQMVRIYADPFTGVTFNIIRFEPNTSATFLLTISGYLVDVS